jgi:hypothetical protein
MDGFTTFLAAREYTKDVAHSARAGSPIVPDAPRRDLRLSISMAIRRLADRIDPMPTPARPGGAGMAGTGR